MLQSGIGFRNHRGLVNKVEQVINHSEMINFMMAVLETSNLTSNSLVRIGTPATSRCTVTTPGILYSDKSSCVQKLRKAVIFSVKFRHVAKTMVWYEPRVPTPTPLSPRVH